MQLFSLTLSRPWMAAAPLAACGMLLAVPAVAQTAVFPPTDADLYDTFTLDDGTGTDGASIAGTALEGGSATWGEQENGENWKFNAAGEAVVDAITASGGLTVNLPDIEDKIVRIQADLDPNGKTAYLGLALK